jgi:hypothetical protein
VGERFAEKNSVRAAVVDIAKADLAVEEQQAVIVLINQRLDIVGSGASWIFSFSRPRWPVRKICFMEILVFVALECRM